MADPKTSGPDPAQLLRAAEEALEAAEKVWPPPVPHDLYDAAASAVSKAVPHLQAHTAGRLGDRMNLLTRAEPGAVTARDSGEKTVTEYRVATASGSPATRNFESRQITEHIRAARDRTHPDQSPHRVQQSTITHSRWKDVSDV